MGFLGLGKEDDTTTTQEVNKVEFVQRVASDVSINEGQNNSRENDTYIGGKDTHPEILNPEEKDFVGILRDVTPMNRRDFLKLVKLAAIGFTVGCAPQPVQDALKPTVENIHPEATNTPEIEKEILLNNPVRLNPNDFARGAEGYPNAIVDRSPFATNDRGEPLFLRYSGGRFDEVTYLHYSGERPPMVGEILLVMYKVPENIGNMELNIVPYAISVQSKREKINLNDSKNHYLVPIVTSGNDSGIVQTGENTPNRPFEVRPDSVSGNTKGFLSWVVLTEIGNELIVEGIVDGKSGIYIDPNNVPEEISSLIRE